MKAIEKVEVGRSVRDGGTAPRLLYAANISQFFAKFLLPYACHFRSKGWVVDGLTKWSRAEDDHRPAFNQALDVNWARSPGELRGIGGILNEIRGIVIRGEYDIVHVHTPVAAMMTRLALRNVRQRNGISVVYTAHGFHFFENGPRVRSRVFQKLEQAAAKWTDYLVVMNQEDFDSAKRLSMVPLDRLVYMPGIGVDRDYYRQAAVTKTERLHVRRELHLEPDERLVLCIAEFIPRKRHEDVLQAFKQVSHLPYRLALAGAGRSEKQIRATASQLGIADRVVFLGHRQDVPALLAESACSILASEQEGLPRSVMESMSMGIPVVGTDIRGTRELLNEGGGILCPVGDVATIAAGLEKILTDSAYAHKLGADGERAVRRYELSSVIQMHEELYRRMLTVQGVAAVRV